MRQLAMAGGWILKLKYPYSTHFDRSFVPGYSKVAVDFPIWVYMLESIHGLLPSHQGASGEDAATRSKTV
jgi:hypothetical protein